MKRKLNIVLGTALLLTVVLILTSQPISSQVGSAVAIRDNTNLNRYATVTAGGALTVTAPVGVSVSSNIAQILGAAVSATNGLPVYPQTSSTWAVTQSTSPWVVSQSTADNLKAKVWLHDGVGTAITSTTNGAKQGADVNIIGGIAAEAAVNATPTSNPAQTGGLYEASPTTVADGKVAAFHFDSAQNLKVTFGTPSPTVSTISIPPPANYNTVTASNGVNSVTAFAAVTGYSIVVDNAFCTNASTTVDHPVHICDGACSTSNWVQIPCPGGSAASRIGGFMGPVNFSGSKSALIAFACSDACTTDVTLSMTVHYVPRP